MTITKNCLLMLFGFSLLLSIYVEAGANTGFIDCNDPCNGGDVNYHLVAAIRDVSLMNYTYRGRLYTSGPNGDNSRDSNSAEETTVMGPTIRVAPGQSLWIKLSNELKSSADIGPSPPTVEDYWVRLQPPAEVMIKHGDSISTVDDPSSMVVDTPNMPGHFDSTNLHLFGLNVEPHMFDPVGTRDLDAPQIQVDPGECYCYQFKVPHDHPEGQYWYHPHLHGSAAVQLWGGMFGLLNVENGTLESELKAYGISNTVDFVVWDPVFKTVDDKDTHHLEVDEFLNGQTTLSNIRPFLVNGQMSPTLKTATGQVLHLRVLCATVQNEIFFSVCEEGREKECQDDAGQDFWVIGADGVTFRKPLRKHILVMAGGQRHELLLQFDKPGNYVIRQLGVEGMHFFEMYGHPHDQTLAHVHVYDDDSVQKPTIPVGDMVFTPGYEESETIAYYEISESESIVFSMGADRKIAPFPQYHMNGKSFSPDRLDFFARPGEAREYVLYNANHGMHSFHIHGNRFQVKDIGSDLSSGEYPLLKSVLDYESDMWRDTAIVPPSGHIRIWVQFQNYTGKSVFHCNGLAREDTGMMATLFIGEPAFSFSRWKVDNIDKFLAVCAGVILFVLTVSCYVVCTKRTAPKEYIAVSTMNEMELSSIDG